jgi:phosphoglycolate phosphatase
LHIFPFPYTEGFDLRRIGTAIFDLDGTLHNTEKALVPAIQMAMIDMGLEPAPADSINALYGEPLEVFCSQLIGLGPSECTGFREGIKKHQLKTLPEFGELYPGTTGMLEKLVAEGFGIAICSNADVDYIRLVTTSLGISDLIDSMAGADGHASKTDRVRSLVSEMDTPFSVMIGDRYHDMEAAAENGIPSIGCLYGYGSEEEMITADRTACSASEIFGVIIELLAETGPTPGS